MFTAKEMKTVDNVVTEMLQEIKHHHPDDYSKLVNHPSRLQDIKDAAIEVAQEQITLAKEFSEGEVTDIRERLAKHLPESRIKLIEEGLDVPTFRMHITKQDDGNYLATIKTEAGDLYPPRVLASAADIEWATWQQYASVVVEAVIMVLQAIGIGVSAGRHAVEDAVKETSKVIEESSKFQRNIYNFKRAWDSAGSSWGKAKALFYLIKDTYSIGILWSVIKTLCQDMRWWEWLITAAKTSAMIIAALFTDGVALIAKIALVLVNAVQFSIKVANLNQLEMISDMISDTS